ncbi:MAG TPA: class I adenylate-forming enzyme family protein [Acidimicrobiales bacterium]|nr:class I adenylate-forming enzyme family protein [Acidimicrobiales bacterium]
MGTQIGDVAREAAQRFGETPLYVSTAGSVLTYAALGRLSDTAARRLLARGVGVGDVVALLLPSGAAYAVLYVAAAKIGAVTAGVNDRLSPPERRSCLAVADPRLVIGAPDLLRSTDVRRVAPGGAVVEVDPGADPADALAGIGDGRAGAAAGALPELPELADDPARPVAIVFTSGTTGRPKGAVFGDRQLDAIAAVDGGRRWGGGGRGLSSTSFAHLGYMTKILQGLRGGGTTFLMEKWSAGPALEMVARHRLTALGGIPTQVALMLAHPSFGSTDTSSIRLIALGGGPATASLVREARARFGVPVVVRYTCTEAGVGVGTVADDPPEDAEVSVGRARAGVELTIRDAADVVLGAGETGQVCLRSAAVMSGYYRDRAATAAALTADGAVRTGDLGYVDDEGRLHLAGRSKEMYVRGGYNVFPLEVEDVLADHPGVAHVAVAPRDDPVMGEIGVAVVVPRAGASVSLASLRAHAEGRLAAYKLPEGLLLTDELPRTAMEKIDRATLAETVRSAEVDRRR